MTKVMKTDAFTHGVSAYGTDISNWPVDMQASAYAFVKTKAGAVLLAEEISLNTIFAEARLEDQGMYNNQNVDAFLERLCAIPAMHPQTSQQKLGYFAGIFSKLENILFPAGELWSPTAMVSQAAVFAVVLGLGVVTGLSDVAVNMPSEEVVDISDGWFSLALEIDYSEELEG